MPPEKNKGPEQKMGNYYDKQNKNFDDLIVKKIDIIYLQLKTDIISYLTLRLQKSAESDSENKTVILMGAINSIRTNILGIDFINVKKSYKGEKMAHYNPVTKKIEINKKAFNEKMVSETIKDFKATIIHEIIHASGLDNQGVSKWHQIIFDDIINDYNVSKIDKIGLNKKEINVRCYVLRLYLYKEHGLVEDDISRELINDLYKNIQKLPIDSQLLLLYFKQKNKIPELLELLNEGLAKNDLDKRLDEQLDQIV